MEKLLARLAHQLDALDEASLMGLWSKYAALTSAFEPTRRWEENALIFSLIQAKRWKNQLFNYNWACQSRPEGAVGPDGPGLAPFFSLERPPAEAEEETPEPPRPVCRVLSFRPGAGAGSAPVPGDGPETET